MTGPKKPPICTDEEIEAIELAVVKLEQKGITLRKISATVDFLINCSHWNAEQPQPK